MNGTRLASSTLAVALLLATSACSSTPARRGERLARLADAARTACIGVPEADVGPGLAGLQVVRTVRIQRLPGSRRYVGGAEVVVARGGRPFMETARLLECRVAASRATGGPDDPLGIHGATVRVGHDVGDVAVLQIRSRRPEIVREINRRLDLSFPDGGRETLQGADEHASSPLPPGARGHTRVRRPADFAPPAVGPARGRGSPVGL